MIQAAKAALRMLKGGGDVRTALADRRHGALSEWRELCQAHVNGKAISLDRLEDVGVQLRLADTAGAFARDCQTLTEHAEHLAHGEKLQAEARRMEPIAIAAQAELDRIERETPRLRAEAAQAGWTHVQATYSLSAAQGIRTRHPRLFDDCQAVDGPERAEALMDVDRVPSEPEHIGPRAPAGSAVSLEAAWET